MSGADEQPDLAPPPRVVGPGDAPFWAAIDAGELAVARCRCGACYLREQACPACDAPASALRWVPAAGRATLLSHVVFDKAYHPYFADRLPYVVAVVALEEGPELVTNLVEVTAGDLDAGVLCSGLPLRLRIVQRGGQAIHAAVRAG
ncbi:MAG: OB-fold domain-containing protein [Gammaproteobacteria bacterium]|nr:OB-fold domain-containing protein [Gammaproteobacteria bacterium]MCP5201886.1 OB-fold domain-containing protein [Gammaproteobacteria bacterium]